MRWDVESILPSAWHRVRLKERDSYFNLIMSSKESKMKRDSQVLERNICRFWGAFIASDCFRI